MERGNEEVTLREVEVEEEALGLSKAIAPQSWVVRGLGAQLRGEHPPVSYTTYQYWMAELHS